jgi:2-oxoglutarate ferredoxin oxidoreductase subunit beta
MKKVFTRPESLLPAPFRYCAGCGHSLVHRLVAEVIDGLCLADRTIGIAPVGCAVFAYDYFSFDMIEAAHGRPPAVATGLKRMLPQHVVFTYQGDGDLAAIGTAEIIHAANRGENISVIFINNATYGMTGGQMAPTTLLGQKTTTTPRGRSVVQAGHPLRMAEILATIDGTAFVARGSVDSVKQLLVTKTLLEKAFRYQVEDKGFSMVEILSPCPTAWGMTPEDAGVWVSSEMTRVFRLGVLRDCRPEEMK